MPLSYLAALLRRTAFCLGLLALVSSCEADKGLQSRVGAEAPALRDDLAKVSETPQAQELAKEAGQPKFDEPTLDVVAPVQASAVDEQGGLYLAGSFRIKADGQVNHHRLIRLLPGGTLDWEFIENLGAGFDGAIVQVKIDSQGKILAAGSFSFVDDFEASGLIRLNDRGMIDLEFVRNLEGGFDGRVSTLDLSQDGLIVAGNFSRVGNHEIRHFARLSLNGTLADAGSEFDVSMMEPDTSVVGEGETVNDVTSEAAEVIDQTDPDNLTEIDLEEAENTDPSAPEPVPAVTPTLPPTQLEPDQQFESASPKPADLPTDAPTAAPPPTPESTNETTPAEDPASIQDDSESADEVEPTPEASSDPKKVKTDAEKKNAYKQRIKILKSRLLAIKTEINKLKKTKRIWKDDPRFESRVETLLARAELRLSELAERLDIVRERYRKFLVRLEVRLKAQRQAEKEAKAAKKQAEKEAKAATKQAEQEAKAAKKQAEKEAKAAKKQAEKEAKAAKKQVAKEQRAAESAKNIEEGDKP